MTDITGFKGFWGLELWSLGLALASAQPSAPVPHNRTLAGSPVMRVHPSGTDWRQERRPQHLQTSSHCMHGYNIVSKITIRPHFFLEKGKGPPSHSLDKDAFATKMNMSAQHDTHFSFII